MEVEKALSKECLALLEKLPRNHDQTTRYYARFYAYALRVSSKCIRRFATTLYPAIGNLFATEDENLRESLQQRAETLREVSALDKLATKDTDGKTGKEKAIELLEERKKQLWEEAA